MQNVTNDVLFSDDSISKSPLRDPSGPPAKRNNSLIRITLPFKDQVSANMCDLSFKTGPRWSQSL